MVQFTWQYKSLHRVLFNETAIDMPEHNYLSKGFLSAFYNK